ncbi:hypothetical protein KTR10_02675 [Candidatus Kaiserbacteria bacterium]|nr:hypothetical protein [Candidatus Kaiserbacteria bacterium]
MKIFFFESVNDGVHLPYKMMSVVLAAEDDNDAQVVLKSHLRDTTGSEGLAQFFSLVETSVTDQALESGELITRVQR